MGGLIRYFRDARAELARVTWPNREQVLQGTGSVLVFVITLTLLIFALDSLFHLVIQRVLA